MRLCGEHYAWKTDEHVSEDKLKRCSFNILVTEEFLFQNVLISFHLPHQPGKDLLRINR